MIGLDLIVVMFSPLLPLKRFRYYATICVVATAIYEIYDIETIRGGKNE